MKKRMRAWVDGCLSAAEANSACYAAASQVERKRLIRAVDEGYAIEVAPCVYARGSYWDKLKAAGRMRHEMKALQELHPNRVFAGPSAAVGWGLAVSNRYLDKAWVASTRKAHGRESSYLRSIIVSHDEPVEHDGFQLTSFGRTVGDCLRLMDFRSGLALLDSALRISGMTDDEMMGEIEHSCRRMAGIKRMRALTVLADGRAESGGESIARATMLELGIAMPDLQHVFPDPLDGKASYRVDFAWSDPAGDDGFVVGELDGFEKYDNPDMTGGRTTAQVIADEHRRQSRLEMCPNVLRVLRFSFSDVMHDREFLEMLLGSGVDRSFGMDIQVLSAGGKLRCR